MSSQTSVLSTGFVVLEHYLSSHQAVRLAAAYIHLGHLVHIPRFQTRAITDCSHHPLISVDTKMNHARTNSLVKVKSKGVEGPEPPATDRS